MKVRGLVSLLIVAIMTVNTGCVTESEDEVGFIEFKTMNPILSNLNKGAFLKPTTLNPPLVGPTTETIMTSLKFCVGDVWVSQEEVIAGQPNNMEWIRLSSSTNTEQKLFEDYSFAAVEVPAGTYSSIKITFRNVFYRHVQLLSDSSITYELLETMGSWTDPCDENDTTWATTNYFGPGGNHQVNSSNIFQLVSEGEKLGGFSIEAGQTAEVTWRLGAGATEPCTTYLIDENSNLEWDCGVDRMDFVCPSDFEYMWDFVVAYK